MFRGTSLVEHTGRQTTQTDRLPCSRNAEDAFPLAHHEFGEAQQNRGG